MSIAYEDTLFADWLKKNRWTLIIGVLLIVAVQAYVNFAPKLREQSRATSWDLYNSLLVETSEQGLEGVGGQLARARQDERVYPWFVFYVANIAMRANDHDALVAVRSELDQLDAEITMATDAGPTSVASFLATQIDARLAGGDAEASNPPATQDLVEITLKVGEEATYTLVATVYPEAAPEAAAAFLAAVDGGGFDGKPAQMTGLSHLTVAGLGDPAADPLGVLPLERKLGYSHVEGALCTVPATIVEGAEPGAQLLRDVQLQLVTNHNQDGRRTVFGQVTEGLDALLEALTDPGTAVEVVSIRRKQ